MRNNEQRALSGLPGSVCAECHCRPSCGIGQTQPGPEDLREELRAQRPGAGKEGGGCDEVHRAGQGPLAPMKGFVGRLHWVQRSVPRCNKWRYFCVCGPMFSAGFARLPENFRTSANANNANHLPHDRVSRFNGLFILKNLGRPFVLGCQKAKLCRLSFQVHQIVIVEVNSDGMSTTDVPINPCPEHPNV